MKSNTKLDLGSKIIFKIGKYNIKKALTKHIKNLIIR